MKRGISLLLAAFLTLYLSACSTNGRDASTAKNVTASRENNTVSIEQSNVENEAEPEFSGSNILIAYFSVPEDMDTDGMDAVAGASIVVKEGEKLGNTEYVAKLIQQTIGGDLFQIETVEPYPLEHDSLIDQAADEQDDDFRPELAAHVEDFEKYKYIFLGYPNWWGDMPQALYTFLEEYDFGAKTIIPFITHGGSGASRTVDTISQLQPGAVMMGNELVLSRGNVAESEETVVDWVQGLGINVKSGLPESDDASAVLNATADAHNSQNFSLCEEGNAPAVTEYTAGNVNYADDLGFRRIL